MNYKIYLARHYQDAIEFVQSLHRQGKRVHATVEAEYGNSVIEGDLVTLAHHVDKYKNNPAPSIAKVNKLPEGSIILLSHFDLDTFGGLGKLVGKFPKDDAFWECVAYIDTHGPHKINKFPNQKYKLEAYWCWASKQPRLSNEKGVIEVTEQVEMTLNVIQKILNNDKNLILSGKKWARDIKRKIENCLVEENEHYRVFITDDVSCSSAYYSPKYGKVPYILSFNTKKGNIKLSCEDGGKLLDARKFVEKLWGEEAGGQTGIAGSPRGVRMSVRDLVKAMDFLSQELKKKRKISFAIK